jgi:hypothetical protein
MHHHENAARPAKGQSVHIVVNGRPYGCTYTVDAAMLTVYTLLLGAKRARLGDAAPETLARLLLAELVYDQRKPRRGVTKSGLHPL